METKFTKGKWELDRDFIYTELSEVICDIDPIGVSKKVFKRSKEEAIANARLIASAPELLGVAIKCIEWCNSVKSIEFVNDLRNEAEAAIKKATE